MLHAPCMSCAVVETDLDWYYVSYLKVPTAIRSIRADFTK